MRFRLWTLLFLALAGPVAAQISGSRGQEGRAIKSLSAEETADLLAGRGMGAARAAELNHFPGPACARIAGTARAFDQADPGSAGQLRSHERRGQAARC